MSKQIYLPPVTTCCRIGLEGWIATTPNLSAAIDSNTVDWGTETTYGTAPDNAEGGDVYFSW
ncbi:MAG: hypothetical protein LBS46_08780 [Dysgonamonadaceae bacterium]|nr:hypothetical protein [Dysgonamonadaceae bacterium]